MRSLHIVWDWNGTLLDDLETHLDSLHQDPGGVLLIGDTPDDAVAARQGGAGVIRYDGGSHHLPTLKAIGALVAHSLSDAIDLALRVAEGETMAAMV